MDKKEQILNIFKEIGKPMRTSEIAKQIGIDSKEVSKLIKELKTDDSIFSPKRCYYDIKK